jgi:integrase/recombinase XerD
LLVNNGSLLANPMDGVRCPKKHELAQRPTLTSEEVDKLIGIPRVDTPLGVRNRAILEVLYSAAIRRNELLGLSVYDVDLKEGFVWVRRGKGGKDRKVPLGKSASAWVRRYLESARPRIGKAQPSSNLFLSTYGNRLKKGELARMIHVCATKAGIKKNVTPHVFRHTAATEMVRNGADLRYVQEYLGHRFLVTTQVYTRVTNPDLKNMILRCHPSVKSRAKRPTWKQLKRIRRAPLPGISKSAIVRVGGRG